MAGESVNENIYLAITFGYGGQKRFQNRHRHSRALAVIILKTLDYEKNFNITTPDDSI
mgnify:CR=1 FL=1